MLATGCNDQSVALWDANDGKNLFKDVRHSDIVLIFYLQISFVKFSNNGLLLAASSDDKTISLWDVK